VIVAASLGTVGLVAGSSLGTTRAGRRRPRITSVLVHPTGARIAPTRIRPLEVAVLSRVVAIGPVELAIVARVVALRPAVAAVVARVTAVRPAVVAIVPRIATVRLAVVAIIA
jgi:hypothetical protein